MRGIIIGTIVACVALIGGAIFFTINGHNSGPRLMPLDPAYNQRVTDGYWKKGAANPKVTLTEYLDFQCPACAAAKSVVDGAMTQLGDTVQLRVKLYPLTSIHANAMEAAKGAEAAGRQGKFWPIYDILYSTQTTWESQSPTQFKATLDSYAQSLNLNMTQFDDDLNDSTITDAIDRDTAAGNRIPLQGTPTFLIDDQLVTSFPPTVDALVQALKTKAAESPLN